jgi:hypothetical protein
MQSAGRPAVGGDRVSDPKPEGPASQEQLTSAGTSQTASASPDSTGDDSDRWGGVLGGVAVFGFFAWAIGSAFFSDPDVSRTTKLVVGAILGAVSLGAVAFALYWLRHHFDTVIWLTNLIALLLVTGAVAVAPVLLLSRGDQLFLLKLTVVVIFALVPGLLYLQFLVVRGRTLWEEFVFSLERLGIWDAGVPLGPEDLYRRKFEAVYGKVVKPREKTAAGAAASEKAARAAPRGDTMLPVLWTTVLLSLGWVLIMQPEALAGRRALLGDIKLLPSPLLVQRPVQLGFIGAYFFVVNMIVRRYFQDDLRADAYLNAVTRLVSVVLIVVVLSLIWPASWSAELLGGVAFLVGIFPQTGISLIRLIVAKGLRVERLLKSLHIEYPLSDLDGLNVWYESRLLEEGIEDMQNLATASLVDLLLRTRIPVGRLVDWIDQAHLYLRVTDEGHRKTLRTYGVRNATDLQAAFGKAQFGPDENAASLTDGRQNQSQAEVASLQPLLHAEPGYPAVIEALLKTLQGEPNLQHVRCWKRLEGQLRPPRPAVQALPMAAEGSTSEAPLSAEALSPQGETLPRPAPSG